MPWAYLTASYQSKLHFLSFFFSTPCCTDVFCFTRFIKQYANLNQIMTDALREYHKDVKTRNFPAPEHTYPIDPQQLEKFLGSMGEEPDKEHHEETQVRAHA